MHLCFVFEGYPTKEDPFMPFVRELVVQLTLQGMECSVIAPQSITRAYKHKLPIRPTYWKDYIDNTHSIEVYQPKYVTFSNTFLRLNEESMIYAAKRSFKRIKKRIDALYAHFWHMGVVASKLSASLPIFVACGESQIEVFNDYKVKEIEFLKKRVIGVVYVGTKAYEEAKALGLQQNTPYIIAPNGYDPKKFYLMDKEKCRKRLKWPKDAFIVSFVGAYNKRKGVDRLSKALSEIEDVYSCFIGSGDIVPSCDNILFTGSVAHDEIVTYLNAADIFVLPTNNEGCCNAIVEALACGLPIISSNQLFNCDILGSEYSIQVDPMNINDIKEAIEMLKNDKTLALSMREHALEKADKLSIKNRAKNIADFIKMQLLEDKMI